MLTAMKVFPDRGLSRWMAWAKSSFPVPGSPRRRTVNGDLCALLHVVKQPKQGTILGDDAELAGFGLKAVEFRIADGA